MPVYWTTERFTFPSDHITEIRKALGPVVPLVEVDLKTANLGCSVKDCFYRDIAETTAYDAKIREFADAVASFSGSDKKPLMLAFDGEANAGWEMLLFRVPTRTRRPGSAT